MIRSTFNSAVFKLREFKSHTPNILGFTAHPMEAEGDFIGVIYKKEQVLKRIMLKCQEDAPNTQFDIDFTEHDYDFTLKQQPSITDFLLAKGGYILLYTSSKLDEYSFKLFEQVGEKQRLVFDSKNLGPGDIYTVTLLEPGKYIAESTAAKSKMNIIVSIPEGVKGKPFNPQEPITVDATNEGFSINEVKLNSSQGLVFNLKIKTDILINFVEDKESLSSKGIEAPFRWTNPNASPKR
jgi:hypothetical protein